MRLAEIDHAVRQVAEQRDRRLGRLSPLPSSRRTSLTDCLVQELPVESALCEAAKRRDQLLGSSPVELPSFVKSALQSQLLTAKPTKSRTLGVAIWRVIFGAPLRIAMAACALIAGAFLLAGRWESSTRPGAAGNIPQVVGVNVELPIISNRPSMGAEWFNRKLAIGPFNLDTSEPASLEASFVANTRLELSDGMDMPAGLSLDLPVRAILLPELTRTP